MSRHQINKRKNSFVFSSPDTRPYRRSILMLVGLGLLPPLAFTGMGALIGERSSGGTNGKTAARLPEIQNFRDIAGVDDKSTYRNTHGQTLRRGAFYRSSWLNVDDAGLRSLEHLGIQAVYDLRSRESRLKEPDRVPVGAAYVPVQLADVPLASAVNNGFMQLAAAQAGKVLEAPTQEESMRLLVADPSMRSRTALLLNQLSIVDGAVVYHCSSGSTLTGWVTALLHTIAELGSEDIVQDYLRSDVAPEQTKSEEAVIASALPLRSAMREASSRYGSMQNFIRDGLQLSAEARERLRQRLLA